MQRFGGVGVGVGIVVRLAIVIRQIGGGRGWVWQKHGWLGVAAAPDSFEEATGISGREARRGDACARYKLVGKRSSHHHYCTIAARKSCRHVKSQESAAHLCDGGNSTRCYYPSRPFFVTETGQYVPPAVENLRSSSVAICSLSKTNSPRVISAIKPRPFWILLVTESK